VNAIAKFAEVAENELAPDQKSGPPEPQKSELLPTAPTAEAQAVREAASILHCDSESCVLSHPDFIRFVDTTLGVPPEKIAAEKERKFKTAGPRNSTELLNNFHIDETLQRWSRVFPEFFAYPFAMMDFDQTGEPFARLDIVDILEGRVQQEMGPGYKPVRRKNQCAGCVLNTDTSAGPGKHWVAVFVDARSPDWTVEYFNSAGRPPPKPMVKWMERARARLQEHRSKRGGGRVETVAVTSVAHQDSQTECGVFALFYIRRRLEGISYTFFQDPKKVVPDDAMTQFRQFIFRDHA
jgi:hypothetical protein